MSPYGWFPYGPPVPPPSPSPKCTECGGHAPHHAWPCRSRGTYTPPTPPRSPECPCGIDRRDCEYHR